MYVLFLLASFRPLTPWQQGVLHISPPKVTHNHHLRSPTLSQLSTPKSVVYTKHSQPTPPYASSPATLTHVLSNPSTNAKPPGTPSLAGLPRNNHQRYPRRSGGLCRTEGIWKKRRRRRREDWCSFALRCRRSLRLLLVQARHELGQKEAFARGFERQRVALRSTANEGYIRQRCSMIRVLSIP